MKTSADNITTDGVTPPRDERTRAQQVLRQWAEMVADGSAPSSSDRETLSYEDLRTQLHELRVHQIELEAQNVELSRIREELEAARSRYFDLYDLAPVGYCSVSEYGLILEANLTAAALLGVPQTHLITQPITRFIAMGDQDSYYLHCKQIIETGTPHECDLRMVTHDGTDFWARLQSAIQHREGGAPVHSIVMSDITERKQAEEALRERVKELTCLYGIADVIARHDTLGEILQSCAKLMPAGWYYPDVACARIVFWGHHYQTENFRETDWRQVADLKVNGQPVGTVELCYLEACPARAEGPFLREERNLIDAIAERLGRVIERKQAEETQSSAATQLAAKVEKPQRMQGTLSGDGAHDVTSHIAFASEKEGATVLPAADRPRTPRSNTEDSSNSTVRQLTARIRFLERRTAELEETLEDRKHIEKAKGLLMERLKLSEPEAMRKLQHESQRRNIKLAKMSQIILQASEILSMDK